VSPLAGTVRGSPILPAGGSNVQPRGPFRPVPLTLDMPPRSERSNPRAVTTPPRWQVTSAEGSNVRTPCESYAGAKKSTLGKSHAQPEVASGEPCPNIIAFFPLGRKGLSASQFAWIDLPPVAQTSYQLRLIAYTAFTTHSQGIRATILVTIADESKWLSRGERLRGARVLQGISQVPTNWSRGGRRWDTIVESARLLENLACGVASGESSILRENSWRNLLTG
jgi:hypothetical protein